MVIHLFVCLSFVSVWGVHPTGGQNVMLHRNLSTGGDDKNPGSTNKYMKFR